MGEEGIGLRVEDDAKAFIVDEGFDPQYGARPLKRAIQKLVENPLSEEMLSGKFKKGSLVLVKLENGELGFEEEGNPVANSV